MATEARLANTALTALDPTLSKEVVYTRLTDILNNNSTTIDEIGILPFLPEAEDNSSDGNIMPRYPFALQENATKLGIPVFCWVPVMDVAYAVLKAAVRQMQGKSPQEIDPGTVASGKSHDWWSDPERRRKVVESTACLMILCPDSYMAVNARKRLVQEGHLEPEKELALLDTILTIPRNCKSSGAWHHRKWLISFMHKDLDMIPLDPTVVEKHLQACHRAAEVYPKCYYAWTMRHWLVEQLGRHWWEASTRISTLENSDGGSVDLLEPLEKEFSRMKTHMERNVSDHSTQQHLQQCMIQLSGRWVVHIDATRPSGSGSGTVLQWTRQLLAERKKERKRWFDSRDSAAVDSGRIYGSAIRRSIEPSSDDLAVREKRGGYSWVARLWTTEVERVRGMVKEYPGHESLWYHLRFLYYGLQWLDSEPEPQEVVLPLEASGTSTTEDTVEEYLSVATETAFVEQFRIQGIEGESSKDQDAVENTQLCLAESYLTWVGRLGLDLEAT